MPKSTPPVTSTTTSFETMFNQLQEIVAQLESGNLPLEATLDLYEQGIQIAQACQQILDRAELRITTLDSDSTP